MQSSVLLVWIGALLVFAGVLFTAWQALSRGRLSAARRTRSGVAVDTLEPPAQERAGGFGLKSNWPGLALIGLGFLLLLIGGVL
jgi:hypothetical protein